MVGDDAEQLEEERRLLYVAMTRARDHLHIVAPCRFFRHQQHRHGDNFVLAPVTRFIPDAIRDRFEPLNHRRSATPVAGFRAAARPVDLRARARDMWLTR
jgi:DNA helicase-2/ATP-dependent DNA helicase PcrA